MKITIVTCLIIFSHEYNNNIFKRYNLADLSKKPMTYILPNILISKRVGSASGSAISTYTNLRKPSQFSSRKSLSQSTTSISATEGDTNFALLQAMNQYCQIGLLWKYFQMMNVT